MTFLSTIANAPFVLTEGAMLERVRRHPDVELDPSIAHAGLIYSEHGGAVLTAIYREYLDIGQQYQVPFITLAPTWRANPERVRQASSMNCATINMDGVRFV